VPQRVQRVYAHLVLQLAQQNAQRVIVAFFITPGKEVVVGLRVGDQHRSWTPQDRSAPLGKAVFLIAACRLVGERHLNEARVDGRVQVVFTKGLAMREPELQPERLRGPLAIPRQRKYLPDWVGDSCGSWYGRGPYRQPYQIVRPVLGADPDLNGLADLVGAVIDDTRLFVDVVRPGGSLGGEIHSRLVLQALPPPKRGEQVGRALFHGPDLFQLRPRSVEVNRDGQLNRGKVAGEFLVDKRAKGSGIELCGKTFDQGDGRHGSIVNAIS